MAVVFACRTCGRALTPPLRELPPDVAVCAGDREDHVPAGFYACSDGDSFTGTEGRILLSLHDVQNTRRHPDPHRLNGCCGLDGCDGPNTVCQCGAVIGTEKSDCWMPWALVLEPDATTATVVHPA